MEERSDRFTAPEDRFEGYEVYDRDGEKIGSVDNLFAGEDEEPEYVGVKMGFLGMNSTLIPMEICRVDESDRAIVADTEKSTAKDGPSFDDDQDITPEFEREVRGHYGLESPGEARERGEVEVDGEDEDEIRVQRTEEELRAGTREREVGGVNVSKRIRTDRERISVPKKREEVTVERVPVDEDDEGRAGVGSIEDVEAEIIEDEEEIRVPIVEEEIVVEKRAVVKEVLRIKKRVVEEEEVIEEDVRKEEVEIDGAVDHETERHD